MLCSPSREYWVLLFIHTTIPNAKIVFLKQANKQIKKKNVFKITNCPECATSGCCTAKNNKEDRLPGMSPSWVKHTCLTFRPSLTVKTMIVIADPVQNLWTNEALGHILHFTPLGALLPGRGSHWLALNQGQPKGSVSLSPDFSERVLKEMLGPLVDSVPLEFSRFPAMLRPLKTTLFPEPALASWRQHGECISLLTWGCL